MSGSTLTLHTVDKIYNPNSAKAVHAVKSLDLEVQQGEIVALLGSSGCGKTSTLRMIAGFEEVSKGSIELGGREIHKLMPAKRNVAMAFEGYSLYPPLTVRENISFALKAARLSKDEIERRVAEITHLLDIENILDRYPSSISGGQQQRASLGRALVRESALHLLDEPMGQLEPQLRALLRGRIKFFIKERGLTAILVTHDQTEANALADRIAVMEDGELQQYAEPAMLKNKPANLFTGTFIGEPPMNVFAVSVQQSGEDELGFKLDDDTVLHYPQQAFSEPVRTALLQLGTVTLGVRPQAVQVAEQGLPAKVVANQWLGDQTHIASELANTSLVAVEHDRVQVQPGESIHINLAADDLHFFHPDSGQAIAHGGELA